jgi:hypothetical protein
MAYFLPLTVSPHGVDGVLVDFSCDVQRFSGCQMNLMEPVKADAVIAVQAGEYGGSEARDGFDGFGHGLASPVA